MALVVLDANTPDHRKMFAAGPNACWLWVRGLAWCRRFSTSRGLIPKSQVTQIAANIWSTYRLKKLCETLVSVGLWHDTGDCYRIHDYEQNGMLTLLAAQGALPEADAGNPEDEALLEAEMRIANGRAAVSAARSEAGKRGALSRWQNGKRDGKADGKTEICHDGKTPPCNLSSDLPSDLSEDPAEEAETAEVLSLSAPSQPSGSSSAASSSVRGRASADGKPHGKRDGKRDGKAIAARSKPDENRVDVATAWRAYVVAMRREYRLLDDPPRNAKGNGQLAQFLKRVPAEDAVATITHYVRSKNARYVAAGHSVGCLLQDAEKLCMEARTGRAMTASAARRQDRDADRTDQYAEVRARLATEDESEALNG